MGKPYYCDIGASIGGGAAFLIGTHAKVSVSYSGFVRGFINLLGG